MAKRKKILLTGVVAVVVILLCLALVQELTRPKYGPDNIPEGTLIQSYYADPKDHDVILVGDCEVYENFSPPLLWSEYGINSYIRGGPQQLIWQSCYLLEDTLRYETPQVVVFNVLSMQYATPQKEEYNRLNLEGMHWSASKWKAIRASMTEGESMLSYVFPLLRYHDRWSDLSAEDVTGMFQNRDYSHNGALLRTDVRPAVNVPTGKPLADYRFSQTCWDYLDNMRLMCEENGAQLVLLKAPSLYPYWYPQWEEQIQAYAREHDLPYLNLLAEADELGIDFSLDTYDGGLHLNLAGAEKATRRLGGFLQDTLGLEDRRGEAELTARWEVKLAAYEADIAAQQARWAAES